MAAIRARRPAATMPTICCDEKLIWMDGEIGSRRTLVAVHTTSGKSDPHSSILFLKRTFRQRSVGETRRFVCSRKSAVFTDGLRTVYETAK